MMCMINTVFKRYEVKYMLTDIQRDAFIEKIDNYIRSDEFGESTICNIYYDTPDFRLIRRSLEKPDYKEKLRLRSYGTATPESTVFLELKKKYDGVVYKRRIALKDEIAEDYLNGIGQLPEDSQIAKEIDYCVSFYKAIISACFIAYDREAFYSCDDPGLRITFDRNIRYRLDDLTLCSDPHGQNILDDDVSLMEIKAGEAMPLWLVDALTECAARQTSFSKYGTVYSQILSRFFYRR